MNKILRGERLAAGLGVSMVLVLCNPLTACQTPPAGAGKSTSGGHGGGAGGAGGSAPAVFTPQGCSFSIAPRPEYVGFARSSSTVGPTPNVRRVRLGLGGNVAVGSTGRADPSTTIGIAWQTDEGTLASEIAWGNTPDPTTWPASNRVSGFTWDTPEGDLGGSGPERMHEAYLCGLTPATSYYYRVGGGPTGAPVWSDVYAFATAPAPGATQVKIALTGDSRGEIGNAWQTLQRRLLPLGLTLQLFSGDMIILASDQNEWEQWLDRAWKDDAGRLLTLGQLLTLSAHGNHENHTALFFGNLVLPQDPRAFPKYGELFFSLDVGPVHVVVVDDAWVVNPTGDPDYAGVLAGWLASDLDAANKNRNQVPWLVTMHHHAEYSSSSHGQDADVLRGRRFFGPIWDRYHVDLAVSGHDHNYERSLPLTTDGSGSPTVQPSTQSGTVYVVCAGSGADSYAAGQSSFTATSHAFTGALGVYGVLTADDKALSVDAFELHGSGTDPPIDTFTITK